MVTLKHILNRLRNKEDYTLRDYEHETIQLIRRNSWILEWYSTKNLHSLYHIYSTTQYFAGWMGINDDNGEEINRFIDWCFSRPIDNLLKTDLSPYKGTKKIPKELSESMEEFKAGQLIPLDEVLAKKPPMTLEDYYQVGKEKLSK